MGTIVARSIEETAHLSNGITIAYDTFGDRKDPTLLLIMGLAGPLTWWNPDLCTLLAERGFYVIRFDNRDVGRSTTLHGLGGRRSDVFRGFVRTKIPPPYTLSDMAGDAVGLGQDRLHLPDHAALADAAVEGLARTWAQIGSPGYPTPPDETRERAGETFDRGISQSGVIRQMQGA